MRSSRNLRRIGAAIAIAAVIVLGLASPAVADTTVSPTTAPQGSGAELTLTVTNNHPKAAMSRVRLVLPPAYPIAEAYPLSMPGWAPKITTRKLTPPVPSLHGDGTIDYATTDIQWIAVAGNALLPGASVDFRIALGPMPEAPQMQFTFQPTYDDGSSAPAIAPATVTLTPAAPGAAGGHAGHDAAPAAEEPAATVDSDQGQGTDWWSVAGWLAALVCAGVAVVLVVRARRTGAAGGAATRAGTTAGGSAKTSAERSAKTSAQGQDRVTESDTGTDDTHRARVSAWSYRDQS